VKLLADQPDRRTQLVRALDEQARGRPAEAAQALAQAAAAPPAQLAWDEFPELDVLKGEAEELIGGKLAGKKD
jgi:CTP:molybdopterin cytidylyltransferase MocA